jgi:hypothetical protein
MSVPVLTQLQAQSPFAVGKEDEEFHYYSCSYIPDLLRYVSTWSGFDFIVQTLENGEFAFLMAMGTVVKKTLRGGESILVDGDSILAFESSVSVDVRAVGNIAAICCGGERIFNTELFGPGIIYLQSMSIDKMRRLFPPHVASNSAGGDDGGDGGDGGGGG